MLAAECSPVGKGAKRTTIEANISQSNWNRTAQTVLLLFTPLYRRGNPANFVPAGNSKCESTTRLAHYAIISESIPELVLIDSHSARRRTKGLSHCASPA